MGQVYQATDTKLNRQVALKILPEAFATDPDRLARFQRESVLTVGEIRRGIDNVRRRDRRAATALERWVHRLVRAHGDRILPVDLDIAQEWGRMPVPNPPPVVDGLRAATAKDHGLTLATRNVKDVARTNVSLVNPFEG